MSITTKIDRHDIPVKMTLTVKELTELAKFLNNESVKGFMEQQGYNYINVKLFSQQIQKEAMKISDMVGDIQ